MLELALGGLHSPSSFVNYNCCPCCSDAFALLVVPVAPILVYSFIPGLHPTRTPSRLATFQQQDEVIHGKFSHVPPSPLCPMPPLTVLLSPTCMQAFHLVHPIRSSHSPPISISLSHSLERHMPIHLFKVIANRLAHFWSYLSLNLNLLPLSNPLKLSLWDFLPGRGGRCYRRYQSLAKEQRWWDESARIRAFFAPSDARYDGKSKIFSPEFHSPIPLIMSYVPRLLPQYRDHCHLDDSATQCELPPSVYRKWHRLVFPNKVRPATRTVPCRSPGLKSHRCRLYPPEMRRRRSSDILARVIAGRSRELHVLSPTRQWRKRNSHHHRHIETSGQAGSNTRAPI